MARSIRRMSAAGEGADAPAQALAANGGDLVDHHAAGLVQAVLVTRQQLDAEERRVGGIARQRADRDRGCLREAVILNDGDRSRFAGVVAAARRSAPQLAPLHPTRVSLIASMKA